jgi:hypothetical protein
MTERAQQQYRTLRELNCFNMDVVEASVSQRRKESLTSSTEGLALFCNFVRYVFSYFFVQCQSCGCLISRN